MKMFLKTSDADILQTLGSINHNASAIPMPSSAMKRSNSASSLQQPPFTGNHARSTSGSRMSLAPGRPSQPMFQRSSSGNNLAELGGFSTVQRNSTSNTFGSAQGRKSYAPVTPAHTSQPFDLNTQRRSSVYSARPSSGTGAPGIHQSFFATQPVPGGVPQDPRRLRDGSMRVQMANELMEYLTTNNFEMEMKHSLTHKTMTSPTQKDFNYMFQWLYHRIDPAYRFQKNIDAEVPPLLKQMRYPFEKSIMKSQIAAVGGNNWYTFLGLLHWMMQLARMMEQYAVGTYDDACIEAGYDVSSDRIIFQFLSDAYREWLSVEDDQDEEDADRLIKPHIEAMAAKFDAANAQHIETAAALEAEHESLCRQIEELERTGPRISKLDEQIKILEEDRGKFESYNNSMEGKVEKYTKRAELLDEEVRKVEQEIEEAERDKRDLQETIDKQGITIQDIERMNSERERLQKGVESTSQRLEESKQKSREKEGDAAKKLDELERMVERYNSLCYQIGVIPDTAPNANGQSYELVLTLNEGPDFRGSQLGSSTDSESDRLLADAGNGYQPHHLLNLDLRGSVKSNIMALRKDISERRNAALETDMNNQDLLDKIREAMDDNQAEVEALGHRVRAAEEEFERTREIGQEQKMKSDTQIERMEKELAKMRQGLGESVQLMEQREMNTNIEYEQLTLKAASLREELHTEIERALNDIVKFKLHVQKSLEDYETFVSEEVERECEEQADDENRNEDDDE
ncbi:MAG: kinetochore-associated Ndc80 complex subunit ndc80 [Bogoriella megaspora]|nr:MAG: kinetochore-associated Ndc80 complex subunit ndc80 [Bogoriella megaspora]